ncbi:MAG: glycoside hydrolase family 65 protein [Oscillospiraceae bacterium]|nr:glycoside hydrolase family 65 protein [Oscillospiraceae bacterium]
MIEYGDWSISASGFRAHAPQYLESIFSQSNGYIGSRAAFLQDKALPHERCTYMAGGFDYIEPGITDMVNLPDPFHFRIMTEGSDPGADGGCYTKFVQRLNLKDGLYTRESVWKDSCGRETAVKLSRFISMDKKHFAALRIELTALNYNGDAEILLGLDAGVLNLPVHDDQTLINDQTVNMLQVVSETSTHGQCTLSGESRTGRLKFDMRCRVTHSGGRQKDGSAPECPARRLLFHLKKNETIWAEKLISVNDPAGPPSEDFDSLLEGSRKAWALRWKQADIEIEADDARLQSALRYNLFQLMQSRPYGDPAVSIGARGLTHSRYKGCFFWDTDIFIQPFFLYSDPGAARDLVRFRLDTLSDARENAGKLNLEGARYPWMCAVGGKEQCHTWDIGRCEIHITADVAYAVDQYLRTTGDQSLRAQTSQLFIETARYWASRFSYDAKEDAYNLLFVKGPDEYCGISSNNAYTVMMARHNLKLGIEAAEPMTNGESVSRPEIDKWREIIEKSKVGYDPERELYLQDDDFLRLEPFDFDGNRDSAPIYRELDYDRLQRYRVLKQADLALLILLLPEAFTEKQKQAIWDCYEPITLHDSSLSRGIHAWAAAVLGKDEKACSYFKQSLFLDLENTMGNTGTEGIHLAALGATWQTAVFGFAGLSADGDGIPALAPRLPRGWKSMKFNFWAGGKRYAATVTPEGHSIKQKGEIPQ